MKRNRQPALNQWLRSIEKHYTSKEVITNSKTLLILQPIKHPIGAKKEF